MLRESWGSRVGFMFGAIGSAVGLANIVRFPYLVGYYGGSAFVITYLGCLLLVGFPVFVTEVLIGRSTHRNPKGAFTLLGRSSFWSGAGILLIITGVIVCSFYSVLSGWILGYLVEAILGHLAHFSNTAESVTFHGTLTKNPIWAVEYHALFIFVCVAVLYKGVRKGLERFNKILLPLMFLVLLYLLVVGLQLENAGLGLSFLFKPNWSTITPAVFLMALGQAFFTLSAGQGTMITYGSYLPSNVNLLSSCFPIVLADITISIVAAVAVFTIVFSVGIEPNAGIGLIFHILPVVFSKLPSGYWIAIGFFLLVALAALTSEISVWSLLLHI